MAEYIEREALIKQMMANFRQASWYGCDNPLYSIVEETILEAHASDVAPVVHGRWIESIVRGSYALICSQCRRDTGVAYDFDYCPNCGAKMDLQEEQKEDKNEID